MCLLGVSGAGKTTLFHTLSGLETPEEGRVFLSGRGHHREARLRSATCCKKICCCPIRRLLDNVALPLVHPGGKKPRLPGRRPWPTLPSSAWRGRRTQYPAQLSGGMRQRAALLRTFLGSRGVVLLDEPFSALDALTKREIHRWYMGMMDQLKPDHPVHHPRHRRGHLAVRPHLYPVRTARAPSPPS